MSVPYWIQHSNLIEDIDDKWEDQRSLETWNLLQGRQWNMETLLWIHAGIMANLAPSIAGRLRTNNVRVGPHIAPQWENVHYMVEKWLRQYEGFNVFSWPVIKQTHVDFEWIHPFADGNGRTGRMLMNWMRVRAGLEPLCILVTQRRDYYDWFKMKTSIDYYGE